MVAKQEPLTPEQRATLAVVVAGRRVTDEAALARLVTLRLVARKRGEWAPTVTGREVLAQEP